MKKVDKIVLDNRQAAVFSMPVMQSNDGNTNNNSTPNNNNIVTWAPPTTTPPPNILGGYVPGLQLNYPEIIHHLENTVPFCRVSYISQYRKPNRTPRLTWAYGQIDANKPNPNMSPQCPYLYIPDWEARQHRHIVSYRGLNFASDPLPQWLENLSLVIRGVIIKVFNFDPGYNSVIIGKYEGPEDQISLHVDTEPFLKHTFCANITLGYERDFQFKVDMIDPNTNALYKQTYEIKLAHGSAFFFNALEHALPARAAANGTRYSISFRNMATNVGIGNSFYYCRGLNGAINDQAKYIYMNELRELQMSNGKEITV